MRRIVSSLIVCLSIGVAGSALARDVEDGKLLVYPEKDNKYKVTDVIGDKVTFYGVAAEVWERKHVTGLLLKHGDRATDEQKHIVYVAAKQLKIDAFIDLDGKEQPIVEAAPPPPPAPVAPPPQPAAATDAAAPPAPAAAPAPTEDPNKH